MYAYFSIKIYKHQKCSIVFILFTNSILLIWSSFLPMSDDKNNSIFDGKNSYDIIGILTPNILYSIPILLSFIFLSIIISYARVKAKILMDFNFISPYKIIFDIGLIGFFFTGIGLTISTLFKCGGEKDFYENICIQQNDLKENSDYYFDNIIFYFNDLRKNDSFYLEIFFVTPLYLIFCFLEFSCEIMTIYYLNPIYIFVKDNLYYFSMRLISFLVFDFYLIQFIIQEIVKFLLY